MATIVNKNIIKDLLLNGGRYSDDPPVMRIYEYQVADAQLVAYAIFYNLRDDHMAESPYVESYTLLMEHGHLTPAGKEWLEKN